MPSRSIDDFRHSHVFLGRQHTSNERKTWLVITLCAAMMVVEIAGGAWFGSVALIADGLHMSTHAGALLIAALAYTFSRRYARDARLTFGTGKLGDLAAFSSAIVLAIVALFIGYESVTRFFNPVTVAFGEAVLIASVGLIVNLVSAYLLRDDHQHLHGHSHEHGHDHTHPHDMHTTSNGDAIHKDHNLRAAFTHVLADAAVSIFVILGLIAGRQWNWPWMDPLVGIAAAGVILNWSWTLIRSAGAVLLDASVDPALAREIAKRLERTGDRISDLHIWRVGPGHLAAIISVVSDRPETPHHYKERLRDIPELSHVSVEVQPLSAA